MIEAAGKSRSVEIFLNFMIMDINRNAMRKRIRTSRLPSKVDQMTRLWGDESLERCRVSIKSATSSAKRHSGKGIQREVCGRFRQRLIKKAGFKYVPKPMPMKTKNNSVIYYLYFASQKAAGMNIVNDIFKKYRRETRALRWQRIHRLNGRTRPGTR